MVTFCLLRAMSKSLWSRRGESEETFNSIDEWKSVTKESDIRQQWFVSVSRKKIYVRYFLCVSYIYVEYVGTKKNHRDQDCKEMGSLEGQCKFFPGTEIRCCWWIVQVGSIVYNRVYFGEFLPRMKKCLACKFIDASLIFIHDTLN